ncbi:MAG: acetolactate synthase small subunit [Lachnospiraceae bacterium]|nr:acetolactate synthase small subunit [Lachnospiraceae bacterium]
MKRVYSVWVENRSGVLSKVAGLFSRRSFNIDSLTVGETQDPTISSMTITSSGTGRDMEQIEKQLNKKLDVIKVRTFPEEDAILREVILLKIKYGRNDRREIMEICEVLKADIVDASSTHLIIHMCDTPEKISKLLEMLHKFNIVEVSRTGTLAMLKCSDGDN